MIYVREVAIGLTRTRELGVTGLPIFVSLSPFSSQYQPKRHRRLRQQIA